MRVVDNGSLFGVFVSAAEVEEWNRRWPCSTLTGRYWFQFDKRNGDLVDMSGRGDGAEHLALSQDAQKFGLERLRPVVLFSLRRVRLNSQGYEYGRNGQYFGRGEPLFHFYSDEQLNQFGREECGHIRATDRADAIRQLRKRFNGSRLKFHA